MAWKFFDANGNELQSQNNVTVSQLANGTDGEIITWDTSGVPTTVAVGAAKTIFQANGTGTVPTWVSSLASMVVVTFTEFDDGTAGTTDTIDWTNGNKHKSTLDENVTYSFTAPAGPTNLVLRIIQDGSGTNTVTWPATVKWPGGSAPTIASGANEISIVSFYYDGTNYNAQAGLAFA